jgi:tRNA(fMet)-specific endonuclease VapC
MERFLLDADAVIDYLKNVGESIALIRQLHGRGDLCSCNVVLAEVYSGLHPRDRARARRFLDALRFLPTSPTAARQAGEWRYEYARRGRALSTTDALIAATAHEHAASLVTGNTSHYPMSELSLISLPRPTS